MTTSPPSGGISRRVLLLALFGLFALGSVLVPVFLGKIAIAGASAVAACGFLALLWRSERDVSTRVSLRTLGVCFAIACVLLLLGGEGRLLYANEDWQVRDAVLADMAGKPWPFAYLTDRGEQVLRAPIGMYLLPALAGRAAGIALLASNMLVLGLLLALGSTLFRSSRARRVAVIIFIAFSGLDIVGTLIANASGTASFDHLERWAPPLQYSSVLTLIFWVPQHALAGWFCALFYLLHRRGSITLGTLAAAVPLAAIWSPLAVIGAVPFAALAGARTLYRGTLRWIDIAIGAVALAVAAPALAYLAADAQQVPAGLRNVAPSSWALFLLLEVAPFLWIIYRLGVGRRFGIDSLALAAAMLAALPFFHVGEGADLVMRASIVPLAVLAAAVIAGVTEADWRAHRRTIAVVAIVLALGAMTGATEIARALRYRPSPEPLCPLPVVWHRQTGWVADISTYLARTDAMPLPLRPHVPELVQASGRDICWSRPWKVPR